MKTSYQRLNLAEREEISRGVWANEEFCDIAIRIRRNPSTVSREIWRMVRNKPRCYHAESAHASAGALRHRGRPSKLSTHESLREYVHAKLGQEWSPEEIAKAPFVKN